MAAIRCCSVCKCEIDAERQQYCQTRLCREHGKMIEKYGGEFVRVWAQERINKVGSLKINYGGVSVRLRRNHAGLAQLTEIVEENSNNRGVATVLVYQSA